MTVLDQSDKRISINAMTVVIIWVLSIRMSCKHTRQWIQDICKQSTVLTKTYMVNILLSINIVINDKTYIQC